MKSIIPWARSNPITMGSSVVMAASIGMLFWIGARGNAFLDEVKARRRVQGQISSLMKTPVKVPPLVPDDPEREFSIAVNQAAIDELTRVYGHMNEQYAQIRQLAVGFNQQRHVPMLGDLFPEPRYPGAQHDAKDPYRSAFSSMLGSTPQDPYPALDAAPPPTQGQIIKIADLAEKKFLSTRTFPPKKSVSELDSQQLEDLNRFKRSKVLEMLERHAQAIHLYAYVDPDASQFPFDVGQWSKNINPPTEKTALVGTDGVVDSARHRRGHRPRQSG